VNFAHFVDQRGTLLWASPEILKFPYKHLVVGTMAGCSQRGGHYHKKATELFVCVEGAIKAIVGNKMTLLQDGTGILIPKGVMHVFEANVERSYFIEFRDTPFSKENKDTYEEGTK
jgi:mannose-6-phosphate isomerase-like protein (cupin superfamily)